MPSATATLVASPRLAFCGQESTAPWGHQFWAVLWDEAATTSEQVSGNFDLLMYHGEFSTRFGFHPLFKLHHHETLRTDDRHAALALPTQAVARLKEIGTAVAEGAPLLFSETLEASEAGQGFCLLAGEPDGRDYLFAAGELLHGSAPFTWPRTLPAAVDRFRKEDPGLAEALVVVRVDRSSMVRAIDRALADNSPGIP